MEASWLFCLFNLFSGQLKKDVDFRVHEFSCFFHCGLEVNTSTPLRNLFPLDSDRIVPILTDFVSVKIRKLFRKNRKNSTMVRFPLILLFMIAEMKSEWTPYRKLTIIISRCIGSHLLQLVGRFR
jgi:hypothetical protein